jgi:hypothetical protein
MEGSCAGTSAHGLETSDLPPTVRPPFKFSRADKLIGLRMRVLLERVAETPAPDGDESGCNVVASFRLEHHRHFSPCLFWTGLTAVSIPPVQLFLSTSQVEHDSYYFGASWAQRNPTSLRRAAGTLALRLAEASTVEALFHAPPRSARKGPVVGPRGLCSGLC